MTFMLVVTVVSVNAHLSPRGEFFPHTLPVTAICICIHARKREILTQTHYSHYNSNCHLRSTPPHPATDCVYTSAPSRSSPPPSPTPTS